MNGVSRGVSSPVRVPPAAEVLRGCPRRTAGVGCRPAQISLETGAAQADTGGRVAGVRIRIFQRSRGCGACLGAVVRHAVDTGACLLWGDKVYSSRQEFDEYLKSKG